MELTAPVSSWSFSRLLAFEACPYRVYLDSVVKSPRPVPDENNPLVRGERIHNEAEEFIRGTGKLTKALQKPRISDHLDACKTALKAGNAAVEENWAFDNQWGSVTWMDENVWLRMKLDVCLYVDFETAEVTDWKTGKSAGKEVRNMQQAQLYSAGVFMRMPEIEYVQPTFAFIDENKLVDLKPIRRNNVPRYIQRFTERAEKLTSCTDFRAKPNRMNCRYCDFGPYGTGACVHGVS